MNRYTSTLLAGALLCASGAWADTVELPLTDDAWIDGYNPTWNYGDAGEILVTKWGPRYGLVRFDAASLAGQDISEATLTLYLSSLYQSGTFSVYPINSAWSEGSVTWASQPPAEAVATAIVDLTTADAGGLVTIDVTAAVQRWADGSLADAGFLIMTSNGVRAFFDAKEMTGGNRATLVVNTGAPAYTGEAIVLDLSDPDNCKIDEPGYYVLDRSWNFSDHSDTGPACGPIQISASGGVTLDLRGFTIESGNTWGSYGAVLMIDTEHGVTLRNGVLRGIFVAIEDRVGSDRHLVTLDGIRAGGAVLLGDRHVTVTGGRFSSRFEPSLQIGADSRVTGADFGCDETPCLSARGSSLIRGCTFLDVNNEGAPAVSIWGDATIFEDNIFENWISISGNDNVVARNLSNDPASIEVSGTGNILEGNIGPSIAFENTGNFFGNNRVALPGGFSGTDGNVDWGGNVTY